MYQAINVVMDTARRVRWNLFIASLYKWKYKEFLLLFVSANEQPPPPPFDTAFAIGLVMFESQYTVLFQDSYRHLIFIYCCLSNWIYPFSTHYLLFFSFNSNRLWILFELYTSLVLSARWQYTHGY